MEELYEKEFQYAFKEYGPRKKLIRLTCTKDSIVLNRIAAQVLDMPEHIFPLIDLTDDTLYIMSNILQSVFLSGEQNPDHPYAMPLEIQKMSDGRICVASPAVLLQQIQKVCKFRLADFRSCVFIGVEESYMGAPALKFSLEDYMACMPPKHDLSPHVTGGK